MPAPVRIIGFWLDSDGSLAEGTVTFQRHDHILDPADYIMYAQTEVARIVGGAIDTEVVGVDPDDPNPLAHVYRVTERIVTADRADEYDIVVEAGAGTIDLTTVERVDPPQLPPPLAAEPLGSVAVERARAIAAELALQEYVTTSVSDAIANIDFPDPDPVVRMNFRGAWDNAATYATQDVVLHAGGVWVSSEDDLVDVEPGSPDTEAVWVALQAPPSEPDVLTTDLAAKVPKSLVDAKGDLIAATADDTPARLAVGADGLPVIADSAQSIGLAYGVPSTGSGHYRDNEHYLLSRTGGRLGGATGYAPGANKVVTWDIEILEPVKLNGEWFYVQTANTGAKMRVGIYAKSTTTGHPTGNPLVTCTEIDASTTSYKTDTFTKTGWIMPGLYAGLLATNNGTAAYRAPAIVQTAGDPACDLGRGTGTVTPYMSWIASWTYSSSALPDVSAFTWTASTTIAAPFVAWKVRRS